MYNADWIAITKIHVCQNDSDTNKEWLTEKCTYNADRIATRNKNNDNNYFDQKNDDTNNGNER